MKKILDAKDKQLDAKQQIKKMIKVNSISGGKTSAYIAANYKADYNILALVRTNDKKCIYPDAKIRQIVSDKIGYEFIGTLEMDDIIHTILDLEQYIGQKINWISSKYSFEDVTKLPQNNVLPSPLRRYCTAELKQKPIFEWWQNNFNEIVEMRIGFRANEMRRAKNMIDKLDENGYKTEKHIIGKKNNRNKWASTAWQKPVFPLIKDNIYKDTIENYWQSKPVRFATLNNCVGCFHRNEILLNKLWKTHTNKMQAFSNLEKNRRYPNDTLKAKPITYEQIKNFKPQSEISFDDFTECDSGHCGL